MERKSSITVEGQMIAQFAVIEEEDDRIQIDGYDLFDLITSQFADTNNYSQRQRLGKFRITVERLA